MSNKMALDAPTEIADALAPVVQATSVPLRRELQELLQDFRLSNWTDDMGDGLPLVDRVTSGGTIGPGIEQLELLADEICVLFADRASSGATTAQAVKATISTAAQLERITMTAMGKMAAGDALARLVPFEEVKRFTAHVVAELLLSAPTTAQAVRMLTREELNDVALSEQVGWGPGEYVEAVQRALFRVNAGKRIPASGEIGSV